MRRLAYAPLAVAAIFVATPMLAQQSPAPTDQPVVTTPSSTASTGCAGKRTPAGA